MKIIPKYIVGRLPGREKKSVVFSTSIHSPMRELCALAADLKKKNVSGEVFFDLLLSNGHGEDRFFKLIFQDGRFDKKSLEQLDSPPPKLKELSTSFYAKRTDLLENSVLSKPAKFLVKKRALRF